MSRKWAVGPISRGSQTCMGGMSCDSAAEHQHLSPANFSPKSSVIYYPFSSAHNIVLVRTISGPGPLTRLPFPLTPVLLCSTPSHASKAYTDRDIRTPASISLDSVQPAAIQPLHQVQERTLPRIPGQQAIHQATAAADDLAGDRDHRRAERRELHSQQGSLLGPVFLGVPVSRAPATRPTPSGSRPDSP